MKPHDQSYPEPTSNLPAGRPESRAIAGRIDRATTALAWDAAPAPALSGTPDLKTLLHGLRRRWFAAFILGTTLAALAAAIAWYLMSPKYTAVAQLRVLALPDKIIPDPHAGREEFKTYIRTIASQLKGRPVIKEALKQDKVVALKLENLYPEVLAFMEDELKVEFQETNEIMTVTLGSCDPNVSITVLKAILDAFNKLVPEAEETQRLGRIAKLEGALAKAKKDLEDLQKRMEFDAQQSKGIVDPRALPIALTFDINNLNQALADRNRVYNELLTARISLEAFLSHINSAQKEGGVSEAAVEAAINADAKMKLLQEGVRAQTRLLRQLGGTYLPSGEAAARKLKEMRAELEERRKEIREELKTRGKANLEGDPEYQRARMEIQIDALKRRGEELDKLVAELSAKVKDSGKVDPKLQELASEIKGKEALVADLTNLRDRDKVELEASRRIQVASDPDLQKKDIRKQLAVTIVAPVLTLVGVCMGLAWLECRQRRVRSANHIAQGLGIPVVGAVPNLPNLERHLVGPAGETDLQGHPVMESIDSLRTRLLREAESMSSRIILVTSAGPGEGKTTLAAHLAGSLARAGRKTLLIDGDLRTPATHQLFELPQQPGFSEVLLGEVEAADAVQPTPIDGLALMASGQWDREVMQALARDGMEGIFEKLLEEFDFLIIDSHPVMAATDALLIGQQSDAVIVSVLREVSRAPQVYGACQRLTALGIRVLGAVVSGTDPDEVIAPPAPAGALAS